VLQADPLQLASTMQHCFGVSSTAAQHPQQLSQPNNILQSAYLCAAGTAHATWQHHAAACIGFQPLLFSIHSKPCHSQTFCLKSPTCMLQAQPLQPASSVQQEGQLRLITCQHQAAVV
jgi:hypothetical protein